MPKTVSLNIPLNEISVQSLHIGDIVYLSGRIFTARDMAHLRIKNYLETGQKLPKDFEGSVIFHAGPVCIKNSEGNWKLNVIGPTTSIRMEPYAELIGSLNVRALIGKGGMEDDTLKACQKYGYVYLQAAPGCAAKLAKGITRVCDVNWIDMGMPEALWDLEADHFGPLVVGMDTYGASIYKDLKQNAIEKLNCMKL